LEETFLRYVLRVKARIPGYMIREEMQRDNLKKRAGRRARREKWAFEKRLNDRGGSELGKEYKEEMQGSETSRIPEEKRK